MRGKILGQPAGSGVPCRSNGAVTDQRDSLRLPSRLRAPLISEEVAPLESMAPTASDGSRGEGYLRKPPGRGTQGVRAGNVDIPFPGCRLRRCGDTYRSRDVEDRRLAAPS